MLVAKLPKGRAKNMHDVDALLHMDKFKLELNFEWACSVLPLTSRSFHKVYVT
jgi:hypothetical protein